MLKTLNMLDIALVIAIAATAFSLFVFVYIRENAIEKKLKTYEKAIDQIYKLVSKNIPKQSESQKNDEFNEAANLIIERFKSLLQENMEFQESILQRMAELEYNNKNLSQSSSIVSSNTSYEANIIRLFESGFDAESIADQLRISIGEVELALNLNGLKRQ